MIDTRQITHWLIRTDEPFRGHAQSFIMPDGTVAWSDGLTPEQYQEARGFPVCVITDAQLNAMVEKHAASLVTDPKEETEGDFWYALEVLPPCRWHTCNGVELFHISERLQHDIVAWHARTRDRSGGTADRFFVLNHHAGADSAVLAEAVREASKAPKPSNLASFYETA